MDLCAACKFAEEPTGFEKIEGQDEHTRHLGSANLNPHVTLAKQTVKVKVEASVYDSFIVRFRYSCDACGDV